MTLFYIILTILVLLLLFGGTIAIINRIRKRRIRSLRIPVISTRASPPNPTRRTPYRVDVPRGIPARTSATTETVSRRRLPRPVQNNEHLGYRKCPRCHSENTLARQYIFKTDEHSFHCKRCDHRFNY